MLLAACSDGADHLVIQAFTPNGPDQAFDIRMLPWWTRCNENLLDAEGTDTTREVLAVDTVAVKNQMLQYLRGLREAA